MWIVKADRHKPWIGLIGQSLNRGICDLSGKVTGSVLLGKGKLTSDVGLRDFVDFKTASRGERCARLR